MAKSKIKTMLICFFDISGIIHYECVPEGTTVNQTFYVEGLLSDFSPQQCIGTFFASSVTDFSRKRHLCMDHPLQSDDFWLVPKL
jgi:hypothetical protein